MIKVNKISRNLNYLLPLIAFTLFLYGCEGESRVEDEESKPSATVADKKKSYDNSLPGEDGVRAAIRGYNQVVIDGNMKSSELSRLHKYASNKEEARVMVFVEEAREKNSVMRSKLERLVFNNISVGGDDATVSTSETWLYDYVDFEGKLIAPVSAHYYVLKYELIRFKGAWIVKSIKEIEPERAEKIMPPRPLYP